MQPTHILWKNTQIPSNSTIVPNQTTHSGKWLILKLIGASAAGFLLGITSLVLTYYARASKYPKNCFNSIHFLIS
jgi:hypothetical protein